MVRIRIFWCKCFNSMLRAIWVKSFARIQHEPSSGWWFPIFFYFHPYLGKWSNLTNIFSDGLKPSTSHDSGGTSLTDLEVSEWKFIWNMLMVQQSCAWYVYQALGWCRILVDTLDLSLSVQTILNLRNSEPGWVVECSILFLTNWVVWIFSTTKTSYLRSL